MLIEVRCSAGRMADACRLPALNARPQEPATARAAPGAERTAKGPAASAQAF